MHITESNMDYYRKYRGKCKEFCDKLISKNPELRLVRGYYLCWFWGKQEHWWCEDKDGNIIDPTKDQFPSKGMGDYEEFDGNIECAECGKIFQENTPGARFEGRYGFCSTKCNMMFVGL